MIGVKHAAAHHQVEGNLGQQRPAEQPQQVAAQAVRAAKALRCQKSKNREREPPNAGEPFLRREKRRPKVVAQHQPHGEHMEAGRADIRFAAAVHGKTPFLYGIIQMGAVLCGRFFSSRHAEKRPGG